MKAKLVLPFFVLLFISCAENKPEPDPNEEFIAEVESNLLPATNIEGDLGWSIEERMEHYGVPGVSIAVINNGEIAWTKTYGVMDRDSKEPVTENTLFQAASISKPVTAYGTLRLVEAGKVDLTGNINDQLKSWQLPENEFTAQKAVTPKNLLNHSAGVTVHGFLGYSTDLPAPTLLQVLEGESPANSDAARVDKVPEESYRYSGGGYNIIQQMMIDVEGKSFQEVMKEQVLSPLGMDQSTYDQPLNEELLKLAATGYLPDGSMVKGKRHTYPEMAPAGLWTTPEDLAKFAINIQKTLKGESTIGLSKALTEEMLTPFVEDFIGIGIFLPEFDGENYFGHGGWNEGFSSELIAHKDKGYGAVVMINSNHPEFISELIRAVASTYNWDGYITSYQRQDVAPEAMAQLTGRYLVNGNDHVEVFSKDGKLWYKDGPELQADEFIKISDSTFVVKRFNVQFQIAEQPDTNQKVMRILNSDLSERAVFTRIADDVKLPVEFLMEGDFDSGWAAFKDRMEADKDDPMVNEGFINRLGYRFMGEDKDQIAKQLFDINMRLYPESFNVYDSYAEACVKLGDNEKAIEFYEKSLELNPENQNAVDQIATIKERM